MRQIKLKSLAKTEASFMCSKCLSLTKLMHIPDGIFLLEHTSVKTQKKAWNGGSLL
jgi:hypothetical protein